GLHDAQSAFRGRVADLRVEHQTARRPPVDHQGEPARGTGRQYVDIPAVGKADQPPLSLHAGSLVVLGPHAPARLLRAETTWKLFVRWKLSTRHACFLSVGCGVSTLCGSCPARTATQRARSPTSVTWAP